MIAFGALGSVCVAVEIIAAYFDNSLYMQTFSELLWSMLTDLNIYLPVALTLVLPGTCCGRASVVRSYRHRFR